MGGGGGGNMLRAVVGRAATRSSGGAGLHEPFSATATNPNSSPPASNSASAKSAASPSSKKKKPHKLDPSHHHLSLSSPPPSSAFHNLPWPAAAASGVMWPPYSSSRHHDDGEWVHVDGREEGEIAVGYFDDLVLGPVPSKCEVENAVSALQQVFDSAPYPQIRDRFGLPTYKEISNESKGQSGLSDLYSCVGSELDQVDTAMHASDIRTLHPYEPERVYDAFHMLQNEPAVQRMVISLSSDEAVWDAVLDNDVVKELRESYYTAESDGPPEESPEESPDNSNSTLNAVRWLFDSTRVKLMEMIEGMANLAGKFFKLPAGNTETKAAPANLFEEKLRTSFFLSIVVLVVVVVARARRG
ncbi:uncharacterized protein J3R85_020752 [Psidium guajava]|nr:uncharacterized protein J3R85_020752 [Psidium guajava]